MINEMIKLYIFWVDRKMRFQKKSVRKKSWTGTQGQFFTENTMLPSDFGLEQRKNVFEERTLTDEFRSVALYVDFRLL